MKTKFILIVTTLVLIGILYAADEKVHGKAAQKKSEGRPIVSTVVITNNTSHELKVTLRIKDSASKEKDVQINVAKMAIGEDAVSFHQPGSIMGYQASKFTIDIVRKVIGVRANFWSGEFTGDDTEISHTFEYRAVVQNPVKIMSTIKLNMIVTYKGTTMNILFLSPEENLDD